MIFLENYTKAVLYTYPLLLTVRRDYEEHIKNKALLSYESRMTTENLMEYIAEEILCKEKLEWLKTLVEGVLDRLSDVERTLLAIRYFGKTKKVRQFLRLKAEKGGKESERKYFRKQQRLLQKVAAMLCQAGLTKEVYERDFAPMEIFSKVDRFLGAGKGEEISLEERRWMGL